MRDHKTRSLPTGIYDVAAVETWLADQAARGWLLEKLGPLGAVRLIRGTPARCQYRLEPVDGETLIRDADLRDYYSEAGWEFVCLSPGGDFRIWRSTRSDPVELHGDTEVEAGAYRRLSRRLYRACGLAALWALGMLYLLYPRASALPGTAGAAGLGDARHPPAPDAAGAGVFAGPVLRRRLDCPPLAEVSEAGRPSGPYQTVRGRVDLGT